MSETTAAAVPRPKHLLPIGILAVLWDGMGAFDYVMTQTQNEAYMSNFSPEQLEFFYNFPSWLVFFWAVAVWGGLAGAILLVMRKRIAAPVLLTSFVSMVVTAFHNFVLANGYEIMGTGGAIFSLAIFGIALALWLYARAMAERGVLT